MLDINPFVKIAWNTNTTKNQWASKLDTTRKLSFEAEYQMVKQGLREANAYHMSPQQFDKQIERITTDNLVFLPILRSKAYGGYSHKHFPVEQLDMHSFVYGALARDLETAQKFVDASKTGDHIALGQLLGYPKCCCEAFQENWINNQVLDPCYEAAINTTGNTIDDLGVHVKANPLTNPMLRYFGIKITPFFPCSFSCNEAAKVGETWFNLMNSLNNEAAVLIKEMLEQPISWSLHKSIIYIKTPLFRGIVNGYYCEKRKDVVANELTENKGGALK